MTSLDLAHYIGSVMRGITRLQVLNKLSNQFVGVAVNPQMKRMPMVAGQVYVHIGQLKDTLGYTGSDEDFIIKYDRAFSLLRKHGYLQYGAVDGNRAVGGQFDSGCFLNQYPYWFFCLNDRAHEYVKQFDDDAKLVAYMGMFLTPPRKSWDV